MSAVPTDLDAYLTTHDARIQRELLDLLRIPSVSARSEHDADTARAAEWVARSLRDAGLEATVHATAGHPVVVGEWRGAGPSAPTVLVYGHYDVQPAEPLELWTTPAFEPTVRDGAVYARGAADDKGQVWCHVEALLAWQAHGGPPVNVTLLVEGEEEIGSPNLTAFVKKHRDALRADVAVVSDTNQFARGIPAITYGLRGLVYVLLRITAADHDLHSGLFGGTVANPANELCKLLG